MGRVSRGWGSQNLEEMPEIKHAVTEIRKVFDWLIHKLDTAEDRLCLHFLKKCQEKLAKLKCQKENIKFKTEQNPQELYEDSKTCKTFVMGIPEKEKTEATEEISEAIMAKNFPKSRLRTYLAWRELREQ